MSQYVTAPPCTILTSVGSTNKSDLHAPTTRPITKHPNQTNPKCSKCDQQNFVTKYMSALQHHFPYCFCNHFTGSPVPHGTRGAYDLIQQPLDGLHHFHWQPADQCQAVPGVHWCKLSRLRIWLKEKLFRLGYLETRKHLDT